MSYEDKRMTKHTPGPWRLGEVRHADITEHGYDGIIRNVEGDPVASVGFSGYSKKTAYANARLIAAAPDLLAALKDYVGETDRVGLSLRGVHAKRMALDVIRKSEGEPDAE